jgi:hypothetical protein
MRAVNVLGCTLMVLVGCAAGSVDDGTSSSGIPGSGGSNGAGAGGAGGATSSQSSTSSFGESTSTSSSSSSTAASTSTATSSSSSMGAGGAGGEGGAPPVGEQVCWDSIDNDNDGKTDCADLDCAAEPTCEELCSNQLDDDGDTLVDCADPVCNGLGCSMSGKVCSGGVCACPTGNTESSCSDGFDNDCDGGADCADSECAGVAACAAYSQLFISEYVEGSSNHKALELFNASPTPVELMTCSLRRYSNGATTPSAVIKLSLTSLPLAPGGRFVVCNPQGLLSYDGSGVPDALCNLQSGSVTHNGDDSYDLFCNGQVVDFIGAVGGGTIVFGQDTTLRRSCSVTAGSPMSTSSFDSSQWEVPLPVDTFDGLGQRSCPNSP